jgi:hypothetical protein
LDGDARQRAPDAVDPGGSLVEVAVLVLLGILAHVPDVPVFVLREEGDLRFDQHALRVVTLPDHEIGDPVDVLREVGDHDVDTMAQ